MSLPPSHCSFLVVLLPKAIHILLQSRGIGRRQHTRVRKFSNSGFPGHLASHSHLSVHFFAPPVLFQPPPRVSSMSVNRRRHRVELAHHLALHPSTYSSMCSNHRGVLPFFAICWLSSAHPPPVVFPAFNAKSYPLLTYLPILIAAHLLRENA
jgi:hypothetical protein